MLKKTAAEPATTATTTNCAIETAPSQAATGTLANAASATASAASITGRRRMRSTSAPTGRPSTSHGSHVLAVSSATRKRPGVQRAHRHERQRHPGDRAADLARRLPDPQAAEVVLAPEPGGGERARAGSSPGPDGRGEEQPHRRARPAGRSAPGSSRSPWRVSTASSSSRSSASSATLTSRRAAEAARGAPCGRLVVDPRPPGPQPLELVLEEGLGRRPRREPLLGLASCADRSWRRLVSRHGRSRPAAGTAST